MNKYSNTKIYKIISPHTDKLYIGSTTQTLKRRFQKHITSYKEYKKGLINGLSSKYIIESKDPSIVLIELYPCCSKKEKFERESFFIRKYLNIGTAVNIYIPLRTLDQWKRDNKEKYDLIQARYREKNRKKINERDKIYRINNLEKRKLKDKKNYEKNKEKILNRLKETITCECGSVITRVYKSKHVKTKKHLNLVK